MMVNGGAWGDGNVIAMQGEYSLLSWSDGIFLPTFSNDSWEKLRKAEAEAEQDELEEALRQLTLRERETRKRLEDMEGTHELPWNSNGKHESLKNGMTNGH
jgi:hypothetical protein